MKVKEILMKQQNRDSIAIKYKDQRVTYRQFHEMVMKRSNYVNSFTDDSSNIGIFLPNSLDYAIAYFTIAYLDKIIVPIGSQAKIPEIVSTIQYCGLKLILTNTEYALVLAKYLSEENFRITIVDIMCLSVEQVGKGPKVECVPDALRFDIHDRDDVAIMLHTSGTTSKPKRVMLTHNNLIENIQSNIQSLQLTGRDKVLIALPMIFGYCNTAQFLTHLYLGASMVIMDGLFAPNKWFKLVCEEKITNFTAVPSMLFMLLTYRNNQCYELDSLRHICFGGGVMPVKKLKELIEAFPSIGFVQTYGQTEASPRVTALLPEDSIRKIGSVGKAIPNVSIRIVDEAYKNVVVREVGEIIVHGANVMKGYYNDPDETAKVLNDGWLHTGDLAFYDEEGYIYLTGRKKNLIISGGLNIYPEEIEEILMCHPAVKEVKVIGEPDELFGEKVVARIVLKEEYSTILDSQIINYCMKELANYKLPSRIDVVKKLEKTITGKIKR